MPLSTAPRRIAAAAVLALLALPAAAESIDYWAAVDRARAAVDRARAADDRLAAAVAAIRAATRAYLQAALEAALEAALAEGNTRKAEMATDMLALFRRAGLVAPHSGADTAPPGCVKPGAAESTARPC